ncbi:MAG TPA: hypothetical protein VHD61_04025 [Lacunisphaera sp.]|nr:hypothetical protein [Lacunisphaera sp.]
MAQPAPGGPYPVQYNPDANTVQGNQPLTASYVITITAPANLVQGTTVNINLGLSVLSKPSANISDAQALSFISLSPAVLTFTGPNQQAQTTVSISVPLGNFSGDYAYKVTASGWPTNLGTISDAGTTVNARVAPPQSTDTNPPSVTLQSPADGSAYTYVPVSGVPVNVPVSFSATVGTGGSPITDMLALLNDAPVSLTVVGKDTLSGSASASIPLVLPGNYTLQVLATNQQGTSYVTTHFSVAVSAPPPTISVSQPTNNSSYSYMLGAAGALVPVSVSANSVYGNISSLAATLDGSPVSLALTGVGTAATATGSATLTVATSGNHTLVFNAANAYGAATPITVPFTVASVVPAPTVAIVSPANGSTVTRSAGDPPTVVAYSFQGGTSYGSIAAVAVALDGAAVPTAPVVSGLNTAAVTGSGSLSFSSGGSHTLNVKVTSSGGTVASASTSFNVTQVQKEVCENLTWLPPVSLNQTVEGGSTVPIKFTLDCSNKFIRDTAVVIAIYEEFRNGSTSTPQFFHYGTGSPNPPDYAIEGKQYHLNFATAKGTHSYQVEVYTPVAGSMHLLGTHEVNTKGPGGKGDNDGDCGDGHGKH